MKKNGFTLTELLVTIVLIGLIFGIGIPGIIKISDRMKLKSYNAKIELIEDAAKLYGQNNETQLKESICSINNVNHECKKISIKELIEKDYLDSESKKNILITNKSNEDISNTCVYIYLKNNRVYSYYPDNDTSCIVD